MLSGMSGLVPRVRIAAFFFRRDPVPTCSAVAMVKSAWTNGGSAGATTVMGVRPVNLSVPAAGAAFVTGSRA
jgi:hypothetical protein